MGRSGGAGLAEQPGLLAGCAGSGGPGKGADGGGHGPHRAAGGILPLGHGKDPGGQPAAAADAAAGGAAGPVHSHRPEHGSQRQSGLPVFRAGLPCQGRGGLGGVCGADLFLPAGGVLRAGPADRFARPQPEGAGLAENGQPQNRALQHGGDSALLADLLHLPVSRRVQQRHLVAAGAGDRRPAAECGPSAAAHLFAERADSGGQNPAGQLERRGVSGGAGAEPVHGGGAGVQRAFSGAAERSARSAGSAAGTVWPCAHLPTVCHHPDEGHPLQFFGAAVHRSCAGGGAAAPAVRREAV